MRALLGDVHIRGLGVIDDAVLPLGPGLTVVTGETGAGKTLVVTGLVLLFGARADAARVRAGAEHAHIDARVQLARDSPAARRARDAGGELDETGAHGELTLRRQVSANGRSRAYVGGAPAPVSVLAELGEHLVTVHGQAEQIRLRRAAEQRATLDRFAGIDVGEYDAAYARWQDARREWGERTAHAAELRQEADLLRYGIAEIEAAGPQPGEHIELAEQAARLAHADALRAAARAAHDALLGDADDPARAADVTSLVGTALRGLEQQAGADGGLDALTERMRELSAQAADLGAELRDYADGLDTDPARLAEIEERRALVAQLVRKYADPMLRGRAESDDDLSAVLAWAQRAGERLASIDVSDEAIAELAARRDAAAREVLRLAAGLSAARAEAATRLAKAVSAELAGLAMRSAEVVIDVRARRAGREEQTLEVDGRRMLVGPGGADEVEFLLRPSADAPALPLARSASGGELSRIMLALEVCLASTDPVPTMVFDEVDAGVGGRAADQVGARLARLARDHQVVVVTHLAQVAAYADRHIVVDKRGAEPGAESGAESVVVATDVHPVEGEARLVELARMLAGTDSATAREHAGELLARAHAAADGAAGTRGRRRAATTAPKAATKSASRSSTTAPSRRR